MRISNLGRVSLAVLVLTMTPAFAQETTVWRAFVGDHGEGRISVIELPQGEVTATIETEGPARLYRTESGETVFAVQADQNLVEAVSSGIAIDDHGDHGDIEISQPAMLPGRLKGERPVHFVEHDGEVAVFYDGLGEAAVFFESAVADANPAVRHVATGARHHGVAAVLGDYILITEPHPEDPSNLPVGINVLDADGEMVGDLYACPDLHGEAASGNILAIACATGLLLVRQHDGELQIGHLPYAEALPDGKSTTLLGGVGIQYFLGNYGADRVVLIDPSADEDAFRLIDLPTRRVNFAIDPIRPKYAYIFTEDGSLRRLDILSGELTDTLALTEPYSMDGEWHLPRPRLAVTGSDILVTDPLAGVVHRVDAEAFERVGEIAVDGMPYTIVAVGGSGETHEHE